MYAFNYIDANQVTLPLPLYPVACFLSATTPCAAKPQGCGGRKIAPSLEVNAENA